MRAIFTVNLTRKSQGSASTINDFLNTMRQNGWEDVDLVPHLPEPQETRLEGRPKKTYAEATTSLWALMPETAADEKNYLAYYFRFQDTQTDVVVTHRNTGSVKFRLINPNLEKLLESCETIIRQLSKPNDSKDPIYLIRSGRIEILEKGDTHEIIEGRVIVDHFAEARAINGKNFRISIGTFIAFWVLISLLFVMQWQAFDPKSVATGIVERLSTVAITTCVVSGFDFFETLRLLKRNKIVSWKVSTDLNDASRPLE